MRHTQVVGLVAGLCLGVALSFMTPANAARNGSGSYSLPNTGSVPNPVVSGTTITSAWANGTLSDLGTEITNSVAVDGQSTMTGPLKISNGSASAPGIAFGSDTNTGVYRIAADQLGIATAGTKQVDISSSSISLRLDTNIIPSGSASYGLTVAGASTKSGIYASGGANGTAGVFAVGSEGTSGARGGYAVYASALTNYGGNGMLASAAGVTDGGTGGTGAIVTGGSGAIGGPGATFQGGSGTTTGGAGITVTGGAGGGAGGDAITVSSGYINMDDVAEPTSSTAIKNKLTPLNIPKAFGVVEIGATPTVVSGFNIASVACDTGDVKITFAQAMGSADFVCIAAVSNTGWVDFVCRGDQSANYALLQTATLTACNAAYDGVELSFVVFGAQ